LRVSRALRSSPAAEGRDDDDRGGGIVTVIVGVDFCVVTVAEFDSEVWAAVAAAAAAAYSEVGADESLSVESRLLDFRENEMPR